MNRVRVRAWVGMIVFLVLAPGIVAGLIPVADRWLAPFVVERLGLADRSRGGRAHPERTVVLLDAFIRFALADGTPAPPLPTAHLVVVGPYPTECGIPCMSRYWRSSSGSLCCASWATVLSRPLPFFAVLLFVRYYEEPTLEREYGDEYRNLTAQRAGMDPAIAAVERDKHCAGVASGATGEAGFVLAYASGSLAWWEGQR